MRFTAAHRVVRLNVPQAWASVKCEGRERHRPLAHGLGAKLVAGMTWCEQLPEQAVFDRVQPPVHAPCGAGVTAVTVTPATRPPPRQRCRLPSGWRSTHCPGDPRRRGAFCMFPPAARSPAIPPRARAVRATPASDHQPPLGSGGYNASTSPHVIVAVFSPLDQGMEPPGSV